jgi:hypothetical protein
MTMPDFFSTRDDLVTALGELVASAKPEHQAKLAGALEAFAKIRGRERYERLLEGQPLFAELIGQVEECTDARLFFETPEER